MIDACCLKKFDHEGTATGSFKTVGGLDSYVTSDDKGYDNLIVFITDIYGYKLKNTHLVADGIAKMSGIKVVVPDILNDDPLTDINKLQEWFGSHGPHVTAPIVDKFFKDLVAEHKPKKLFAIGFCFGAFFIPSHLGEDGCLTAGAIVHPSTQESAIYGTVRKPILISVGIEDVRFDAKQREEVVAMLIENKVHFQLDLFTGAPHGYEIKGDMSNPLTKYAKEKTMLDQAYFFEQFL